MTIASDETSSSSSTHIFASMSAPTCPRMPSTMGESTVFPTRAPNADSDASHIARRIHISDEKKIKTRMPIQTTMVRPKRESQSTRNTCRYCRNPARHQMARTRYDSAESASPDM